MNERKYSEAIEKLKMYYPENKVFSFDSIDNTLREKIASYSKNNGFENTEKYLNFLGFEVISAEEAKKIRSKVIYTPGNEPEIIKLKVDSIINRLKSYYPDRVISNSLEKEHKKLYKNTSGLAIWLGYTNIKNFLKAYGYEYDYEIKKGRKKNDNNEIIKILIEKYSDNPIYTSVNEILVAEPEISGKIKTLSNVSQKLLGKSLKKYLLELNVLKDPVKLEKNNKYLKDEVSNSEVQEKNKEDIVIRYESSKELDSKNKVTLKDGYISKNLLAESKLKIINDIDKCLKIIKGKIKDITIDDKYNLCFVVKTTCYHTKINVKDNISFIDDILEKVFEKQWISGFNSAVLNKFLNEVYIDEEMMEFID